MADAMSRCACGATLALALVLVTHLTSSAQGDRSCTASWFDPVRFDAILRVELSQLPAEVLAGLDFEVTTCGDAVAEVRVLRAGAIVDRRTVDLLDVPNAARARLLAFVTAELVRVAPLHDEVDLGADGESATDATEPPSSPVVESPVSEPPVAARVETRQEGAPREHDAMTSPSTTTFDVSKWGHQTDALRRWSLGLDQGVRVFFHAQTRQNVLALRLVVGFVVVEVRQFAPQRLGDTDVIRFDGLDVGLGGQHLFRARHLDTVVGISAHVGVMRVVGSTQRLFGVDRVSYDLTTRVAAERRFGRYAMRFGLELAYVHGQRVVDTSGTTLAEAHGVAAVPFLGGSIGSWGRP